MTYARNRQVGLAVGILVAVVCLFVFVFRGAVPPRRDKPSQIALTPRPGSPQSQHSVSPTPIQKPPPEGRSDIGVLVWPGMSARTMNYSRQILSWMKEWGFEAGFVTVERGASAGQPSPALPADIAANAWTLSEVSSRLNAIVVADGELSDLQAVALKEYLISGGWLIMPSPEDGHASGEVEELLQLKPSRSATLMASEEPQSGSPLGAEEVRVLTSHPAFSGIAVGSWLEWTGPAGRALYSKGDSALPLLCFRRPELPAMRLIPFGEGGVVHLNFPLRPGSLIEEIELKSFLGETLTWLWGRGSWAKPAEKEGTVLGIVRKKDGTPIPAAKVTAKVFSESGEAAQTLEATSSEDGKFSLSFFDNAIYWVKADAEGYYQADMYLMARPQGEGREQIEVLMEPEGAIFGHAYYGPGEDHPAIGISVTLAPNCRISSTWEKETVTDGNARFSFDHLPAAQTFYLIAKAEGWMAMQEAPLPLEGESLEVDIHLDAPRPVEGTTIDAATRKPLCGVEVQAYPDPDESSRFLFSWFLTQIATSDEDGKFTLTLPPGRWLVAGEAQGFSPITVKKSGRFSVVVSDSGEVEPPEVVVQLCPHAVLHGTVFASSGAPAPQAEVTIQSDMVYRADENGRYSTDSVPPSVSVPGEATFQVRATWGEESADRWFGLQFSGDDNTGPKRASSSYMELLRGNIQCDMHLRPPEPEPARSSIVGTVMDEAGRPVSFAKVDLCEPLSSPEPSTFSVRPRRKTISSSDGQFEFSGVRQGLWLVRARKKVTPIEGQASLFWGEKWQTVAEGAPESSVTIQLSKAHIHGRILQPDGTPVRDCRTTFYLTYHTGDETWDRPLLGEEGEFSLFPREFSALTRPPSADFRKDTGELPAEGWVRVRAIVARYTQQSRRADIGDVRWGESSLVVVVAPQGSIRGRLMDSDTQLPVRDALVKAWQRGRVVASSRSKGEGIFLFPNLEVGYYTLAAWHDDYWTNWKDVEVLERAEAEVEMEVSTYWTIRGRLLLFESRRPFVAEVHTPDGDYLSQSDGRFAIAVPKTKENMGRSLYTFTVVGEGLRPVQKSVPYPQGTEVEVGDLFVEREEAK